MRILRCLKIALVSLCSLELAIWIVDWFARWDWLKQVMADHPKIATLIHSPFVYLVLLILILGSQSVEKQFQRPRILARFVNCRTIPDSSTVTVKNLFDSETKTPGWDEQKLDWIVFIETQLANDSDTPTTVDDVEVRVRIKKAWGRKESARAEHSKDFSIFSIDKGFDEQSNSVPYEGARYTEVPSLLENIKNVPLTKGIGHRGWLRFKLNQVNQRDIKRIEIDVWLVDALQGKHKLEFKKKGDQTWDKNFLICKE